MKRNRSETQRRKAARRDAKIARLEAENARLRAENAELKKRLEKVERLVAKLRKDSSTSSKPPSSDIVKPPKDAKTSKKKGKRKKGAQPGHPKHEREPFAPEEIDEIREYTIDSCPDCGTKLVPGDEAPRVVQQVEIVDVPIRIEEHRGHPGWCSTCQKVHYARLPAEVEKGQLAGPRLTALVAYMKGACHASFSTIRKFLRDVVGIRVSRGYLRKLVQKVTDALEQAYNDLLERLPSQLVLNVDETGHKENGAKFWTWCFRAEAFTLFKISRSRGSDVLFDVLGREFEGVLGCDYFSAYRKYMKDCHVLVQFCLAHLIRDIRYLTKLKSRSTVAYGERLLEGMRGLFNLIHSRQSLPSRAFKEALATQRDELLEIGTKNVPATREAQNLKTRFEKHGKAYFEFITTPGIEPTNNLAEQAIRFVVIDRLVTQGTRSEKGRESCERMWTVIATCARQGRSVFEYLFEATKAFFRGEPPPALLSNPP